MEREVIPVGGRISHFLENWKLITKDPWIIQCVEGIQLDFTSTPYQPSLPNQPFFNQENQLLVDKEIQSLLDKNAITPSVLTKDTFISNIFLVPKKDGGQRPVFNLKHLNVFLKYEHFKMEGIHLLKDLLQKNDWMVKIDLTDAYLTLKISEKHRKYLRFFWKGKVMEFRSLPFGIAVAPRIFTKLMKVPTALLRRLGIRMIIYLDDILIMNQSRNDILSDLSTVLTTLEGLGFLINKKKSIMEPSQTMEFLGYTVKSTLLTLSLPREKVTKIKNSCKQMLEQKKVSVRDMAQLIGQLTATNQAILPGPLHYRSLQILKTKALHSGGHYDHQIYITQEVEIELQWWLTKLDHWNGKALLRPDPHLTIQSDASLQGWGANCQNTKIRGLWGEEEKTLHINQLELKAAMFAVQSLAKDIQNKHVLLQLDNKTAVVYINKMGGTVSKQLNQLASQFWNWCLQKQITVTADYIPGKSNVIADWESRHFVDYSNWKLNTTIFKSLMLLFGKCNVDLFADRLNSQLTNYYSWKPDPQAKAVDSLLQPWKGIKGYAFPPFCLISSCLAKIREEGAQIVLVTPIWQAQAWYPLLLQMSIEDPVLIPMTYNTLLSPMKETHPLLQNQTLKLAGWKVSGDPSQQLAYQRKQKNYSSDPGNQARDQLMTVPGISGLAGVIQGKLIPFQHLWPLS